MSSIEVWTELQELKKRVEALERRESPRLLPPDIVRKRPGPPKGYKRKPQPSA
jgi:hypothetical protein